MGTILKTNFFLNSLASGCVLVMNLRKPCIIKDEFVSPGCTRANSIMYFLYSCYKSTKGSSLSNSSGWILCLSSFYTLLVIVKRGISTPDKLLHNVAS